VHFSASFDKLVTVRRIEAAWKQARKLGTERAQPNDPAYSDAKAIDDYLSWRLDDGPPIAEIVGLNLEQLAILSPDF